MEWSNELILEFINLYEKHPVLWDPKHSNHKNRNRLNDAWLEIAGEFSIDVTVDVLRKKKESLMATYRSLSKKVRDSETTGSGAKDVYKPTWFAYDAIDRFIRATGKKTASLSSEETQMQVENSQSEQEILQDEEVEGHENEPNLVRETRQDMTPKGIDANVTLPPPRALGNKRRIGPNLGEGNISKHLKLASDALTTFATKSQPQTLQDAPALYGQLLAVKLRQMKARTQIILQNKIDNLVFEAQLSEIDSVGTTVGRSVTTNFISQNSITPAQYSSPSSSHFSSSPTYVPSPGPSHTSQENDNLNIYSQSTDKLVYVASPGPSHTSKENDNLNIYSQSADKLVYVASPGPSHTSQENDNLNIYSQSTDKSVYVASPVPSHTSQENDNLNIYSQSTDKSVYVASPGPSNTSQDNVNVNINSQSNENLLRTYCCNAHATL